jgi:hypothetical protein
VELKPPALFSVCSTCKGRSERVLYVMCNFVGVIACGALCMHEARVEIPFV